MLFASYKATTTSVRWTSSTTLLYKYITVDSSLLVSNTCKHVLFHFCNYQNGNHLGKLSPNRDPCVTISSVWAHKWVWMLAYLTLVLLLFLAISISIFNIFKYYFYTSFCAFSESIDGFESGNKSTLICLYAGMCVYVMSLV